MPKSVLHMSMSLDGFITGPNEGPDNGLGDGGERLHEWVLSGSSGGGAGPPGLVSEGVNGEVADEFMSTGAVVAGRRTFEWGGDHHGGVPIIVYSRSEPEIDVSGWPLVSYLNDIKATFARAREAAGNRDILVHGVTTAQLALAAGVLDELEIHLVPVLFGAGRRLFGPLAAPVGLERTRVLEGERGVTHVRFRVLP